MNEVKQVTIYLKFLNHRALKVLAAERETTISEIIQKLVEGYLLTERRI